MKHRLLQRCTAFFLLLTLFTFLLPTSFAAQADEIQDEIKSLEEEADQIAADKEALNAELSETNSRVRSSAEEKEQIDREINLCISERDNINAQIHQYNLLIAEKQAGLDKLQDEQSVLMERYQLRMRTLQEYGDISIWSVLFTSDSFVDLLSHRVMIEEIALADQRMLQSLREKSTEILTAKGELAEKKAVLEQKKSDLATVEDELAAKRERADELLAALSADKQRLKEEIDAAEEKESALLAKIAEKEEEYNRLIETQPDPPAPSESGFLFPVDRSGFVCITSPYGMRTHPITGVYKLHDGVDLASYQGTPVYASKSGTVTGAEYDYYLGNYVVINHGDGFSTLYGHMLSLVVSAGEYVSQGQLIGYVGSTGIYTTGPHLHFTVYYCVSTVNPMNYISLP